MYKAESKALDAAASTLVKSKGDFYRTYVKVQFGV